MYHRPVFLIVHRISYRYITGTVNYLVYVLESITRLAVQLVQAERIDEVDIPKGSIVFIVGDPFPSFSKQPNRYYVFLNFSLLYNVTGWRSVSLRARRWIAKKHRAFLQKCPNYDMILDFFQPQTDLLREEFKATGVKVFHFLTNVYHPTEDVTARAADRPCDMCVVGTLSPRREKLYRKLAKRGYRLSPYETSDLGKEIRESKIVLNVHLQRSATLEAPRIFEALNMGSCLLTEDCYGLARLVPSNCYRSVSYRKIVASVDMLLEDPQSINEIGWSARQFMEKEYSPKCCDSWKRILRELPWGN